MIEKRSEGGDSFNPQTTLEFPMIILSGGKYFTVSSNVLYGHHVVVQQLTQHEWSIEYDKHSSIKCNELSHSGVHSCSFTWQKRDFISLSGARGRSE